MSFMQGGIQHR